MSEPVFTLVLNEDGLYINDWPISKPQFDSANYRFISYVIYHAGERLRFADVALAADLPMQSSKRLSHYLNELNFKGRVKDLFFPVSTGGYIMLRNPITAEVLERHFGTGITDRISAEDLLDPDFF